MLDSSNSMLPRAIMKLVRFEAGHRPTGALLAVLGSSLIGLLALSAIAPDARSQTAPSSARYQVLVGDLLRVDVAGRKDISGQYTVEVGGTIRLPVIGGVNAAGRTTSEIATDVSRRVSLVSRSVPLVTVTVLEASSSKYFVLGAVLLPGSYNFVQPPTAWEAISKAGGPTEDADLSVVEILSEAQTAPNIVDVAAAVRASDFASLHRLRPGDTVRVPRRGVTGKGMVASVVYVFGAVGLQGPQPLAEAPDLVRALIRSGPSPDADFKSVEIVRLSGAEVVSIKVNMNDYFSGASLVGNPELQAGDTVHLPRQPRAFGLFGALGLLGTVIGLTTSILIISNNN